MLCWWLLIKLAPLNHYFFLLLQAEHLFILSQHNSERCSNLSIAGKKCEYFLFWSCDWFFYSLFILLASFSVIVLSIYCSSKFWFSDLFLQLMRQTFRKLDAPVILLALLPFMYDLLVFICHVSLSPHYIDLLASIGYVNE